VLGIADAGHSENDPSTANPLIVQIACAVPGADPSTPLLKGGHTILLQPGSLVHHAMQRGSIEEQFTCSYALAPRFRAAFEASGMLVTGEDEQGEARVVERRGSRFHVATLFQPQLSSREGSPHPLIVAFLAAAASHQNRRAPSSGGRTAADG
jgi:CTP synthase (UTP-ammonia lyase)